jgi:ketopantoate reductase
MHPSARRYIHTLTRTHTRARERAHTPTYTRNTQARLNPALARVTLIARGAALDRLRAHGLEYNVRGEAGEGVPQRIVVEKEMMRAEPTCGALRESGDLADYVILCVKTWQVTEAAREAAQILRENGSIVTSQNGVAAPAQASAAAASDSLVMVGIAKVCLPPARQ